MLQVRPEKNGVVELVLDRPPGNRISLRLLRARGDALSVLAASAPGAVLLRAEGEDFSHGADLADPELAAFLWEDGGRALAQLGRAVLDAWASFPCPTVVSATGHVLGAGGCFFASADFKVARAATLRFPEVERGMHLSWGAVPRLVAEWGLPTARRLALAGDPLDAASLPGVVDGDGDAARELAERLARLPGSAVRAIKAELAEASAGTSDPAKEVERFADSLAHPDFAAAMRAWISRR